MMPWFAVRPHFLREKIVTPNCFTVKNFLPHKNCYAKLLYDKNFFTP